MKALGRHLIVEMEGCNDSINQPGAVRRAMMEAVQAAQATLLNLYIHTFNPQGVTGVAVLAESHLAVHTWPEYGYAAVDVFTCGQTADPEAAVKVLEGHFQPQRVRMQHIPRGVQGPWKRTTEASSLLAKAARS